METTRVDFHSIKCGQIMLRDDLVLSPSNMKGPELGEGKIIDQVRQKQWINRKKTHVVVNSPTISLFSSGVTCQSPMQTQSLIVPHCSINILLVHHSMILSSPLSSGP